MPRAFTPPLQLVTHPPLSDQREIVDFTWSDGVTWRLHKFLSTDVLQPLIDPGPDGIWGTYDDPFWFPPQTPGNPAVWNGPLPPGKKRLQIPTARWARVSAVYTPHKQGYCIPTQIIYDKCPPSDPRSPWQVLRLPTGKGEVPKEPGLGNPFSQSVNPDMKKSRWIWVWVGVGEFGGVPIPLPNPYYYIWKPTEIELQKQQIDNFFSKAFTAAIRLGFPHESGSDFKELDYNYVRDLLRDRPQYARLLPAMSDHLGDICHMGMNNDRVGDGFVERVVNQFLGNCARHKWTPAHTLQCWRACAYDVNPYKLVGLVPGLSTQPPRGPWPGTQKPPGWQGDWPGNWQGLYDQVNQEIPLNPNCYEVPAVPELRAYLNIVSFTVTPATIAPGGSATLKWVVANAAEVHVSPNILPVPATGQLVVRPASTTQYSLQARGHYNDSEAAIVALTVAIPGQQKPPGWQGPWPIPWPQQKPSWWPSAWQWPPPVPTQSAFNWPQAPYNWPFPQARPPYWPQPWQWPPPRQAAPQPPDTKPPCWQGPWPPQWPQTRPPWWPQPWPWPPGQPPSIGFPFPQPPYNWPFPQPRPPWWPQPWPWPPPKQSQPIPGPRGPAGPKGTPGVRGPAGPRGLKGDKGECECEIPPPPDLEGQIMLVTVYDFRRIPLQRKYL
jgi:hypothetical protein